MSPMLLPLLPLAELHMISQDGIMELMASSPRFEGFLMDLLGRAVGM